MNFIKNKKMTAEEIKVRTKLYSFKKAFEILKAEYPKIIIPKKGNINCQLC